jgi:hypothetical protein
LAGARLIGVEKVYHSGLMKVKGKWLAGESIVSEITDQGLTKGFIEATRLSVNTIMGQPFPLTRKEPARYFFRKNMSGL